MFCVCQLEIVLETAHKVEEIAASGSIPSKEMLIEKVIFKLQDIVTINALDVDPDYATKGMSVSLLHKSFILQIFFR